MSSSRSRVCGGKGISWNAARRRHEQYVWRRGAGRVAPRQVDDNRLIRLCRAERHCSSRPPTVMVVSTRQRTQAVPLEETVAIVGLYRFTLGNLAQDSFRTIQEP